MIFFIQPNCSLVVPWKYVYGGLYKMANSLDFVINVEKEELGIESEKGKLNIILQWKLGCSKVFNLWIYLHSFLGF